MTVHQKLIFWLILKSRIETNLKKIKQNYIPTYRISFFGKIIKRYVLLKKRIIFEYVIKKITYLS